MKAQKNEYQYGQVFGFKKLKVYQKDLDYVDEVYRLAAKLPKEVLFGLSSQFNDAAVSISVNIGKGSTPNFLFSTPNSQLNGHSTTI